MIRALPIFLILAAIAFPTVLLIYRMATGEGEYKEKRFDNIEDLFKYLDDYEEDKK